MNESQRNEPSLSAFRDALPRFASTKNGILALLIVCFAFLAVCGRFLMQIPVMDDYDGVLMYQDGYSKLHTLSERLHYILFTQHNEYRPVWSNAIISAQFNLQHHSNLVLLCILGDLQVVVLAVLLYRAFAGREIATATRIVLFLPIALLVLQLNCWETLNWAMPGLQNFAVLMFALLALDEASRPGRWAFIRGCMGLALAVAASGNGLLVIPAGALMLWQRGSLRRLFVWLAVGAVCVFIYFHGYDMSRGQQPGRHTLLAYVRHLNISYILNFMGSAVYIPRPVLHYDALVLGALLLALIVVAVRSRFYRQVPGIAYFGVFLLLTSVGVSGIRSGFGLEQSLSARYKIYSDLFLVCAYVLVLYLASTASLKIRKQVLAYAFVAALLLNLRGAEIGYHEMKVRYIDMHEGMRLYVQSGGALGPHPIAKDMDPAGRAPIETMNRTLRQELGIAVRDGIYRIPVTQ